MNNFQFECGAALTCLIEADVAPEVTGGPGGGQRVPKVPSLLSTRARL
jgi:hypothetical protein